MTEWVSVAAVLEGGARVSVGTTAIVTEVSALLFTSSRKIPGANLD
jgi:hypothetical protein